MPNHKQALTNGLMINDQMSINQQIFTCRQEARVTHRQIGFTLIEVLLALMIFAALSLAGYQVLSQVQQSSQISADKTQRLEDIQRALIFMDNDFRQIAPRSFSHEGFDGFIFTGQGVLDSDEQGVIFTRLGWSNPEHIFPRSQVLKVGYRLNNNTLERVWWYYPDTEQNQAELQRQMLSGVTNLSFRFYSQGQWQEMWSNSNGLPDGIEVILELEDYGRISRVYKLLGKASDDDDTQAETN